MCFLCLLSLVPNKLVLFFWCVVVARPDSNNATGATLVVRKSRRLQNEPALDLVQIKNEVVEELALRGPNTKRSRGMVLAQPRGFHGNGRVPNTEHIVSPFSLASVGTTIW